MPQGRVHPNPGSVQVSKTLKDMTAIRKHGFQKPVVHLVFFAGLPRDRIMVVANTTAAHQNESFGGLRLGPSCWQPLALEMCMGKLHDRPMDKSTTMDVPDKHSGRQHGDGSAPRGGPQGNK
jgi:hypothetical protein